MDRRRLLAVFATLGLAPRAIAQTAAPARVALIDGGWDGASRIAGVAIDIDDGWKTYWRVPGESGVPPEFTWEGSRNIAQVEVLYPLATRYDDASGDAIGYKHRVVFPLRLTPIDRKTAIDLSLAMFFGVCKEVCVPKKFAQHIVLPPGATDHGVTEWLAKVPSPARPPFAVTAARPDSSGGKVRLRLTLAAAVDDIFVEGAGDAFFHKPSFTAGEAVIAVDNIDARKLSGMALKFTLVTGNSAVEQTVIVP